MFCNLYVKNLPSTFGDNDLMLLFERFGKIHSCRTVKNQVSFFGCKIAGFVCFEKSESAKEAKSNLHGQSLFPDASGIPNLYVEYHKSKEERQELINLNSLRTRQTKNQCKVLQRPPFPQLFNTFENPNEFRQKCLFGRNFALPFMRSEYLSKELSADLERENNGELLYRKISTNLTFQDSTMYHPKIVGIFLDLERDVIDRLLRDDVYFTSQVEQTLRQLKALNKK